MSEEIKELTTKQKHIKSCMEFLKCDKGYPVVDYLKKLTETECFHMMVNIAFANDYNKKLGRAEGAKLTKEIKNE